MAKVKSPGISHRRKRLKKERTDQRPENLPKDKGNDLVAVTSLGKPGLSLEKVGVTKVSFHI